MKKIINYIGTDGLLHILACYVIAVTCGIYLNAGLALFIAVFAGVLKEVIWDGWIKKGSFELKDLLCDLIGAVAGFIVLLPLLLI
jgi:VanZ family protein